jgi:DNA-binding transcriptional ArsR family regulator
MPHAKGSIKEQPSIQSSETPADQRPDAERLVSDPETLKALSDPLRLRILEAMVAHHDSPWSVKELAARLAVPQTRLYHHIELLTERDLIRVAEQRVVSGIIETRYRVAALSFRLDHRLLSGDSELRDAGQEVLHTVFDAAREDVARALNRHFKARAGDDPRPAGEHDLDPGRPVITRGLARLTPERAAEFRDRLMALINEFQSDPDSATAETWGLLAAFYRQDAGPEESSHD